MNYLQAARSPRRWLPAVIATLLINAWLIWALFHGNVFPFAAPEHLIRVNIYPAPKQARPASLAPAPAPQPQAPAALHNNL